MSYASILKTLAGNAEQTVGKLAEDLRAATEAEQALDDAENAWREAMADGVVDETELSKLRGVFEKAGLGAALSNLKDVEAVLRQAKREIGRGSELRQIDLNLALQQTLSLYQGASDALSREGEMYDNVVANLRG